jgi:hypothetical protein
MPTYLLIDSQLDMASMMGRQGRRLRSKNRPGRRNIKLGI